MRKRANKKRPIQDERDNHDRCSDMSKRCYDEDQNLRTRCNDSNEMMHAKNMKLRGDSINRPNETGRKICLVTWPEQAWQQRPIAQRISPLQC